VPPHAISPRRLPWHFLCSAGADITSRWCERHKATCRKKGPAVTMLIVSARGDVVEALCAKMCICEFRRSTLIWAQSGRKSRKAPPPRLDSAPRSPKTNFNLDAREKHFSGHSTLIIQPLCAVLALAHQPHHLKCSCAEKTGEKSLCEVCCAKMCKHEI